MYVYLAVPYTCQVNPCKPKGGHNYPPPVKNLRDSFVINLFRTPFSEKKDEWTKKLFQSKKNEKKYMGGSPEPPNLAKIKKIFPKNINLPVYWHFTIWKDKIILKVDSESLDIYLAPCKKAKRSEIYFPATVVWSRPIFADFAAVTNFRGNSYFFSAKFATSIQLYSH